MALKSVRHCHKARLGIYSDLLMDRESKYRGRMGARERPLQPSSCFANRAMCSFMQRINNPNQTACGAKYPSPTWQRSLPLYFSIHQIASAPRSGRHGCLSLRSPQLHHFRWPLDYSASLPSASSPSDRPSRIGPCHSLLVIV